MDIEYNPKAIAQTINVEELYDLDITIARFILPRLMVFKQHCERTPRLNMPQEEWNEILDKMIYAFERIAMQTEEDTPSTRPISRPSGTTRRTWPTSSEPPRPRSNPSPRASHSITSITAACGGKAFSDKR